MYEKYKLLKLTVDDGKLAEIFERLEKAKEEIRDCYHDLAELEVLEIRDPLAEENNEGEAE